MEHGIDLPNKGNKIAVMYDEGELTAAISLQKSTGQKARYVHFMLSQRRWASS